MSAAAVIMCAAYVAVAGAFVIVLLAAHQANKRRESCNWTRREIAFSDWARRQIWRVENGLPMQEMTVRLYLGLGETKVEAEAVISKDGRVTEV